MRARFYAALMLASFLLMMLVPVCFADTEKGDQTVENIVITLDRMHNRCCCKWEKPAAAERDEYTAILEAVDEDGTARELLRATAFYHSFQADDYAAYACQENGFPYMMRVRVECCNGNELIAEGVSEPFDPRDLFPEKETLEFGTDIPLEAIRSLSWDSAGMSIEDNWHMGVSHYEDDEYMFYSSKAGEKEIEKKIKKSDWDQITAIIAKGWVKRDYIMDPEMVVLDGGGEGFAVSWEDEEHENWQAYYSYQADEETEEELQKWLAAKDRKSRGGWKLWTLIPAFVIGAAGAVLAIFRK